MISTTEKLTGSLANTRLYGEGVSDLHDSVVLVVLVVQNIGVGVKHLADAVPTCRVGAKAKRWRCPQRNSIQCNAMQCPPQLRMFFVAHGHTFCR